MNHISGPLLHAAARRQRSARRAQAPQRPSAAAGAGAAPQRSASAGAVPPAASAQVRLGAPAAAGVTYTDRIKKSGRLEVDALLAGGKRWFHEPGADGSVPSAVAKTTLTYSFISSTEGMPAMDAQGFQALDGGQQQRVRDALAYLSKLVNVSFQEVASGGDLKYGANAQENSAGYARYPNEGAQVMLSTTQGDFNGAWAEGSYEWQVVLHETAHALGLKHPGNYNAGGGGTPGPYLPRGADHRGNTIMSYYNAGNMKRVVASDGQFTRSNVNASTFQGYDIAALQYLYGQSTTVQAETYSFEAGAVMSKTLWNPNEGSAIDLSNQTQANVVDLRAGRFSSIAIRDPYADTTYTQAQYDRLVAGNGRKLKDVLGSPTYSGRNNLLIASGSRFTAATGGSGNDSFIANKLGNTLDGGGGDDRFFWNGGNLTVSGGDGTDAVFVKRVAGAKWTLSEDRTALTLVKGQGEQATTVATLSLSGIESVKYWDGTALKGLGQALYKAVA